MYATFVIRSFDLQGHGEAIADQLVKRGDKVSRPADPKAEGWTFIGWYAYEDNEPKYGTKYLYDFETALDMSRTLYARWEEGTKTVYTVSFDNRNYKYDFADQLVVDGEKAVEPTDPAGENENILIQGWYTDATFTTEYDFNKKVKGNITLYAKWSPCLIVSFMYSLYNAYYEEYFYVKVIEGEAVAKPKTDPWKSGYTFTGWYSDSERTSKYDFKKAVTADLPLYAGWTEFFGARISDDILSTGDDSFYTEDGVRYNSTLKQYEMLYTGYALTPAVTVTSENGLELTEGVDYKVSYSNNINVSKSNKPMKIKVTGKGSFKGKTEIQVYIVPADLSKLKEYASDENQTYLVGYSSYTVANGKKCSPVLYSRGKQLKNNKDFTLDNKENIYKDTTVTLTGKGNFTGSISVPVKVLYAEELKAKTIKIKFSPAAHVFDHSSHTLSDSELQVRAGSSPTLLEKDEDYSVTYYNNVNAGTATFVVSGTNGYVGSITKTFKIQPDKNAQITVTLDEEKPSYSPAGVFPSLTVTTTFEKWGEDYTRTLTKGRDYMVSASKNKAVGLASYKVTFLGNYKGRTPETGNFNIVEADLSSSNAKVSATDMIYKNPGKYFPKPYVELNGVLLNAKDYTVKYYQGAATDGSVDGLKELSTKEKFALSGDSETITMVVSGKTGGNLTGSVIGSYKVVRPASTALDLSKAKITVKDKKVAYTGSAQSVSIQVQVKQYGMWVTVPAEAYNVTYINNVAKGKATILVSGGSYEDEKDKTITTTVGSKTATFNIVAADLK